MTFRVIDEDKPRGTVTFETDLFRERLDTELVHYRDNEEDKHCAVCGCLSLVWTDSQERWEMHAARCV